jgi:ABC-type nitrate/sulfonate/bicarbonate transport system substrate-binding protein
MTNKRIPGLVLAAGLALAASGCGSDGGSEEASSKSGLEPVTLAIMKLGAMANVDYADKEGFFADHGLDVELLEVSPQNLATVVQSGQADIGLFIPGTGMVANEKGAGLTAVWQNETGGEEAPASNAIMVPPGSDIRELSDLSGKKVGISAAAGQGYAALATLLEREGVSVEDLEFVEAPFDTMTPMLSSGQIDAAVTLDPYTTQIQQQGAGEPLSYYMVDVLPNQVVGAFWGKSTWVDEHTEEVQAFQAALAEASDELNGDEALGRKAVAEYSGLPADLVDAMPPIRWNYTVDPEVWQAIADMMTETGQLEDEHEASEYLSDEVMEYAA